MALSHRCIRAARRLAAALPFAMLPPAAAAAQQAPSVVLAVHNDQSIDPARCVAVCFDHVEAWSTPAYVSFGAPRSATLVYNSRQALPLPVIQVDVAPQGTPLPDRYSILLSVAGSQRLHLDSNLDEVFYSGPDMSVTARLGFQFDASAMATGVYAFEVTVRAWSGGSFAASSVAGRLIVVNQRASPFGAGWGLAGAQKLHVTDANGSVLITDGDGSAAYFHRPSAGAPFERPHGDFSNVVQDGTVWRRIYPSGDTLIFNSAGDLAFRRDRFGNDLEMFTYTAGVVQQIEDVAGRQTGFSVSGGRIVQIGTPGGRTYSLSHNASNELLSITDGQDSTVTSYAYSGTTSPQYSRLMLTRTDARGAEIRAARTRS